MLLEAIRSSYWFVPTVMAFAAMLLGAGMVWVDVRVEAGWLDEIGWYQAAKPSGAREVLSTVAGSMITVAGVVFSITIVALSYASSQYGPRVLTNFMSDRGNTVTLGTFIATFVYCLVVLRTIRGGDEGSFVPQLAVLLGIALALCSIGVLIYFIHHVLQSIHINHVVASIGRQLIEGVDERFPDYIGQPIADARQVRPPGDLPPGQETRSVSATAYGYIQSIDGDTLLKAAEKGGVVLRLRYRPGDFVTKGRPLADASPAERVDEEVCEEVRGAFVVGVKRTPFGDLHFLIDELVEVGARALSSGVNDPLTAATCMDWLGAAIEQIATRKLPDPARTAADGDVRVIALPDGFGIFLGQSFGQLRGYAARDPLAALHFLKTLGEIAARCVDADQLRLIDLERSRLVELAERSLGGESLEAVRRRSDALAALFKLGCGRIGERRVDWLGGGA
ncbi:MAG TPA: DUF2254 domain-containing protein [Caulobacteraceae bacterium]|nr:DUF2254 domain-containing protein [Caulobacteraceae bacterium]